MKKKTDKIIISKKSYDEILDAWSKMNVFCAYLESPELFTEKYSMKTRASEIYKHLDRVVTKLPD